MAFREIEYNSICKSNPKEWWNIATPQERLWFSACIDPIETLIDVIKYTCDYCDSDIEEVQLVINGLRSFVDTRDPALYEFKNQHILKLIAGSAGSPVGPRIFRILDALEWYQRFNKSTGWELGFAVPFYFMDAEIAHAITCNLEIE